MSAAKQPETPPTRPRFSLVLEVTPGRDPVRSLRHLLKFAGRQLGLRAISVREVRLDVVTSAR
jgi:hypothetical protein